MATFLKLTNQTTGASFTCRGAWAKGAGADTKEEALEGSGDNVIWRWYRTDYGAFSGGTPNNYNFFSDDIHFSGNTASRVSDAYNEFKEGTNLLTLMNLPASGTVENVFVFNGTKNKSFTVRVQIFPTGTGRTVNITISIGGASIGFTGYSEADRLTCGLYFGFVTGGKIHVEKPPKGYNDGFILKYIIPSGVTGSDARSCVAGCALSNVTYNISSYVGSYINWWNDVNDYPNEDITSDPIIAGGGVAGGGGIGGGGTFDDTSDEVEDDELPSASLSDIGFVTLYTPTLNQIRALAQFMWSNNFFDNVLKLKADLFDCVIGLHILPFKPSTSGTKAIYAGNVETPVNSLYTNAQFQKIECGAVAINEFWGNYLDYAPYTQIELMLPFIGSRALDTDEVMGKTLSIRYKIDIATGAFVAVVMANGSVMYQYTGACAVPIPITGQDKSAMISDTVRLAVDGGKAIASGGAGAPAVASDAVNAIAGAMKQDTVRSGNLGGASGFLAKSVPYLIIKRPRQSLAKTYIDELGYPCNASYTLGSLSGYTRCEKVEFKSATATSEEHAEIERILCNEGVLL